MTRPVDAPATVVVARRVVVRDLELTAKVGIYTHERQDAQPIRLTVELEVDPGPIGDHIADAVSYETVVAAVKARVARGHVNLVETLAERIADDCLGDPRVWQALVRVEKLHAVAEAAGVGAEVVKARRGPRSGGAG